MEARSETTSSPDAAPATCAECEQPTTSPALSRAGTRLCAECVAAYYVACSGCGSLIAKDESLTRETLAYCPECFSAPVGAAGGGTVDETLIESLIAEYVSLHAEEKWISDRMEVIKEQLKSAAATRQREGNAVTLLSETAAIRCSYRASLKCDAESAEALAQLLDEEEFASLFERKTSFTPIKDQIAEFLAATDEARQAARTALRAALRETETVTLSVVPARK